MSLTTQSASLPVVEAKPADFRAAEQRVYRAPGQASFVERPLVTP